MKPEQIEDLGFEEYSKDMDNQIKREQNQEKDILEEYFE